MRTFSERKVWTPSCAGEVAAADAVGSDDVKLTDAVSVENRAVIVNIKILANKYIRRGER